jgi:hypothetical protein
MNPSLYPLIKDFQRNAHKLNYLFIYLFIFKPWATLLFIHNFYP